MPRPEVTIMVGQWISQVRKMLGIHTGSRRMNLMQVMLGLALCVLIGGTASTAAAWRGNDNTAPQRLYDRQANGIWFSDDAGISWAQAGALPSRPLAMAVAEQSSLPGKPGPVFVGTESRGLLRSDDGGASWQPVDSEALSRGNAAPLAVTALAIDPENEQIVYAATNIWLGTSTVHLTPLGVAVSVDGGRQWLQLSTALLSDAPVWHLGPVAGQPLSVVTVDNTGSHTVSLKMSPELQGLLQDGDPAVRASAARAIALIGGKAPLAVAYDRDAGVPQGGSTTVSAALDAQPTVYRYAGQPDGTSEVQRSQDGGFTWATVGMIPELVSQLAVNPANDTVVFARTGASLWRSENSGVNWASVDSLPGRPLALAFAGSSGPSGLVYAGTDTQGLYSSLDSGTTWQAAGGSLSQLGAGSLAVTAITVNPSDQNVVYAAATFTMSTPEGQHNLQYLFISVDDGRRWFEMTPMPPADQTITQLNPISGASLAVLYGTPLGNSIANLEVSPTLVGGLDNADAGIRAATARVLGLYHDPALLPVLMNHLHDSDSLAGDQVARAIGMIGGRSASADLLNLLVTAPAVERTRAALALGLLKSEEAVPGLAALLSTGDPQAQRVAAEALAAIGTPSAMRTLVAPLADLQMTSARHAAMGGLETAGPSAVASLVTALHDGNAVVRANAAEMLGWLKPADAVADLARLLSDSDPAVQAQAAWALGEIGTEPARLALIPAPVVVANSASILALNPAPIPVFKSTLALDQTAARPVALAPLAPAPLAPLAALPGALAEVLAEYWSQAMMVALLVLLLLAIVLIGKGPRRPNTHFGPV
jgi:HEAT repeat protein